jgi:hypothetical protein
MQKIKNGYLILFGICPNYFESKDYQEEILEIEDFINVQAVANVENQLNHKEGSNKLNHSKLMANT